MAALPQQPIRVPNLPQGPIVDKNGNATQEYLSFLQGMLTLLQKYFGQEGLVAPTQANGAPPTDYITQIQDNQMPDPITGNPGPYSCQYGTIIYNSTANTVMMAINNGSNVPVFKTVTLT